MAEDLQAEWPDQIEELTLTPSEGGVFEVDIDGKRLFSKRATGRHAADGEIEDLFMDYIKQHKGG